MNERTFRVLEFEKIKDSVRNYAKTSGGKNLINKMKPKKSRFEVINSLEETKEALDMINIKGAPPFRNMEGVKEGLLRASKGGSLNPLELLNIGNMLRCSRLFKEYTKREEDEVAFLKIEDLVSILGEVKSLEDDIERAIISEDEISDRASSTLYNIRRNLKEKNSSVREKINSLVKSNSSYLQDNLYTMRGDRYVLPVRIEYKSQVPGIVHDSSSTGATVYIEPTSLVNLNNEIKELMIKEAKEIERILRELTDKVRDNIDLLKSNNKMLGVLDFIFAKANYALKIEGTIPKVSEDGSFDLISARHPLIDIDKVIASDIYLGKDYNVLMITGPNTGGKTVTIKTVGSIHLMALSGLLIPAMEGSTVGFYYEIFADIGDEQSIEQSLSTFSGHMTNIVDIMKEATKESLVIFDELGAGTDPTEGAALAASIIENLKRRGTKVIATTHYSELKSYALRTEDVENASVEFDIKTLRPTYRLLIGVPGKSNAFEISRRLGLSNDVIKEAKEFIDEENLQFEDLIKDLQEKSIIAKKEAREAQNERATVLKLRREYEEKLKRLDNTKDKAYMDARREAKDIISKAKEEADDILKAMRELEKLGISGGGRNRLEEERKKLKDSLEEKERAINKSKENDGEAIKNISLGMEAFLPSLNQNVIVISLPDNKGEVQVEAGIMKISVKAKDLRVSTNNKKAKKEKKKREVKLNLSSVDSRVDLRGMDALDACYTCDKYLDDAYRANLSEVSIVHGKGTGVLRKAINDMLKRHPHVKSYRLGIYGEGGDGVTIVTLK
ncbi:endonuclease MutS2 [Clostridium chrysemydis]|uniref:endonuclease MutS2 n=1 Tax=Clostridium chrysemydis TaxID=2665504 RepID=UPI0018837EC0|nr:endonuclease MutS2 [Clostridium chrysemydis]